MENELDLRFGGIQRLYGFEAFRKIQSSHCAVIGLGGVGSWAAEALVRTGVGHLTLVDFDDICVSNTNRQLHAMEGAIGQMKGLALKERFFKINPDLKVNYIDEAYGKETESLIFSHSYDVVIDAIDHGPTKFDLVLAAQKHSIPIVVSGAAGGRWDFSKIRVDDLSKTSQDPMLARLRGRLRREARFPRKGKMKIPCVYTLERASFVDRAGEVIEDKPEDFNKPLDCATGFGTATHVTGTFGFALAHLAIDFLKQ